MHVTRGRVSTSCITINDRRFWKLLTAACTLHSLGRSRKQIVDVAMWTADARQRCFAFGFDLMLAFVRLSDDPGTYEANVATGDSSMNEHLMWCELSVKWMNNNSFRRTNRSLQSAVGADCPSCQIEWAGSVRRSPSTSQSIEPIDLALKRWQFVRWRVYVLWFMIPRVYRAMEVPRWMRS